MYRFAVCLQNHDQIGNRAVGDRLNHAIAADRWRAATMVLLTVPMTPLLFMGQEWGASSPFQYFTDLESRVGRMVTEGRRKEFAEFPEFSNEEARARIPDPQAASTFEASKLRWSERDEPAHAAVLRLYQALLALRLRHRALGASEATSGEAEAADDDTIALRRADGDDVFLVVVRLRGAGSVDVGALSLAEQRRDWETVLTTEDPLFATDPLPIAVDLQPEGPAVQFARAGGVILRKR